MTPNQKKVTGGVIAALAVGAILLKNVLVIAPVFPSSIFVMRYPPGRSEKDYRLGLEFSTNMRDWQDKWFQRDGAGSWHVWHSNEHEFYRQRASPL